MEKKDFVLSRKTFSAVQTVLDSSFEQSVEKDFVLPDYYPDIFRIMKCVVLPQVVSSSINGDKLTFETAVLIRVLYVSENDSRVNCLEQKLNFTKTVDLDGACINPFVNIKPVCDYVNCRVVNQRRLDIRGAVTSAVKVEGEILSAAVDDATGYGIQLKKQMFTYPAKRLVAAKRVTVIDELQLSESKLPVGAVIRTDCTINSEEQKMIAGKLITKGEADIKTAYTCVNSEGEDKIETMKFTLPFSQIIDIDGIDDTYDADVEIIPSGCELIPQENGKSLECELVLMINCTAYKYETAELVTDAYSTMYECETEKCSEQIRLPSADVEETVSASVKVSCGDEKVLCVYDCTAKASNVSSRLNNEKHCFVISGNVMFSVIGMGESKTPFIAESECAFEKEIPLPEDITEEETAECISDVCVTACSYYLSDDNNAEIKADLKICGKIIRRIGGTMLGNITIDKEKPKKCDDRYALKLCYCGENEDIWEIAKKYSTSVNAIMEENELESDKSTQRGMLLIPLMN